MSHVIAVPPPPYAAALSLVDRLPDDIRTLRDAGITQAELHSQLGVHRMTLNRWETATYVPRNLEQAYAIQLWAERVRQQHSPS